MIDQGRDSTLGIMRTTEERLTPASFTKRWRILAKIQMVGGRYYMHGDVWEWCQDWHGDYLTAPLALHQCGEANLREGRKDGGRI